MKLSSCMFILISLFIACATLLFFLDYRQFPAPTGPYGIGIMKHHLINAQCPGHPQDLHLHIWYPTDAHTSIPRLPYDSTASRAAQKLLHRQTGLPCFFFSTIGSVTTWAEPNQNCSKHGSPFPIIIIVPGMHTVVQEYSWLCQELASHGYCVIGIDLTSTIRISSDHEKQEHLLLWINTISCVITYLNELTAKNALLANRLDLDRIGLAGHSFCGHVVMRCALTDQRMNACINLDGMLWSKDSGVQFVCPMLMLLTEKNYMWKRKPQELEKLFHVQKNQIMPCDIIMFKNVGHTILTDLPLLLNYSPFTRLLSYVISSDMQASSARGYEVIVDARKTVVRFFDKYLKKS